MANNWVVNGKTRSCYFEGKLHNPRGFAYNFTANADGTIDDSSLILRSGLLIFVDIYFDDIVPPNAMNLVIKRKSGSALPIAGTSIITTTESIKPNDDLAYVPVTDGFYLTASGNTTPNAKGIVVLNFMV